MGKFAAIIVFVLSISIVCRSQDFHKVDAFTPSAYFLGIVSGDFNGDGHNDVAISNSDNGLIEIYLNAGDGTFSVSPDHSYNLGSGAGKLVAGYFDTGSTIDIAALLYEENTIRALLSNGDGTFTLGTPAAATTEETATFISTFKEIPNGLNRVALGNKFAGTITLYVPNGDGSFKAPAIIPTVHNAEYIGAGDLDNDGDVDLTVGSGSGSTLMFHLNDGNGDYSTTQEYVIDQSAGHECFITDLNGDDVNDMVVVLHNYIVNSIRVFHGLLGGGFDEVQAHSGLNYPINAVMHDIDGKDGPDLVTTDENGVYFFLNNGNGNLLRTDSIKFTGFKPRACAVAKFNSDRFYDVALVSIRGGRVYLSGAGSPTENVRQGIEGLTLYQNYPNPVVGETTIPLDISRAGYVAIDLYSIDGKYIRTLSSGIRRPGVLAVSADLSGLAPGNYYYRLVTAHGSVQRMLTVTK